VRLSDLREDVKVDTDNQATSTKQLVNDSLALVQDYFSEGFSIVQEGKPLELEFQKNDVLKVPTGTFAQYFYTAKLHSKPKLFDIRHDMFFENDRLHRGLIVIEYNVVTDERFAERTALVFSRSNTEQSLDLENLPGLLSPLQFIGQGVIHVAIGFDHILFLIVLLLPAALRRESNSWVPVSGFKSTFWPLFKIVTTFTIAHSITLAMAALELITLPSTFVEPVIALTIVLMALNNIFPKYSDRTLLLIFIFGLFHGLGFASVLGDLAFRIIDVFAVMRDVILTFNIGIELAQIIIVCAVFPVLFLMRKQSFYIPVILHGCSALIGLLALYWFFERIPMTWNS